MRFPLKTGDSSFGSFVFKILLSPLSKFRSGSLNRSYETLDSMFSGSKIAKIWLSVSFKLLHNLFLLFCKPNYFPFVALVSLIQPLGSSRAF